MQRYVTAIAMSAALFACTGKPGETGSEMHDQQVAAAEAFIDAFYSFDPHRLNALLDHAANSKTDILYYQGWAEGGNYRIVNRGPYASVGANSIACPITDDDDLINALGITFDVTDTFTLTFSEGNIVSVETGSNDRSEYGDAQTWIETHRPELIEMPCQRHADVESTPGLCVKATVQGFREFAATKSG